MISKYVSPPTLPTVPLTPSPTSTTSYSNEEEETERFVPKLMSTSVPMRTTAIPTATITGLPYKSKKSNIFALTSDNNNPGLIDIKQKNTNPFINHIPVQSSVAIPYNRRQIRSKPITTDPKSPYYCPKAYSLVQRNANLFGNTLVPKHRRSSDSTLNQKSLWRHRWGDMSGTHVGRPENAVLNGQIPGLNHFLSPEDPKAVTIHQHYYPEGHWGWVLAICVSLAHFFTSVLSPSSGFFVIDALKQFEIEDTIFSAVIIGCLSTSVTLFLSPVVIAVCRRKSIRLIAIFGGLVTALGCLFTSFATQFHQLFVSYGVIVGIGVSMTRETAVIMIGQYFKKKREFVEIFVIASTGLGIAFMPLFLTFCIRSKNWRFGFQALALITFITFFLAVLYRPASLYHPQRRAILHLKSLQKRSRMKEQMKCHLKTQKQTSVTSGSHLPVLEKPPYFDFSVLKSRTIQILICGTCISSFGTTTPLLLMALQGSVENIEHQSLMALQAFMGIGMVLGTIAIGAIIVKNSVECMIARQYLCQASCFMLSASLLAFTALDDYSGYVLFVWIYGFFYGGYQYSLKMFIYEKVRARNFNRAWGYIQFSQSIPTLVGIPISAFLNEHFDDRTGYYLSSLCIALGSLILFFIDAHKKRVAKKRKISSVSGAEMANDTSRRCSHEPSFDLHQYIPSFRPSNESLVDINLSRFTANPRLNDTNTLQNSLNSNHMDLIRNTRGRSNSIFSTTIGCPINAELTCISEEIVLDNLLEESILNNGITSCNKEDKYLMYSEFENNLNNLSEEAKAIIKKRKEDARTMIQFHEANCPLARVVADKNKFLTNPLESTDISARQRRASFAGFTTNISSKMTNNVKSNAITEEKTNCEKDHNSCPNCGDQLNAINNVINDQIAEEEEDLEEDSINV